MLLVRAKGARQWVELFVGVDRDSVEELADATLTGTTKGIGIGGVGSSVMFA
jgi:hypothetical protein